MACRPLLLLDCGCGSAHLTFGVYHYLTAVRGLQVEIEGVDVNARLMERCNALCADLGVWMACMGWGGLPHLWVWFGRASCTLLMYKDMSHTLHVS